MHENELEVDADLVHRLLATQFPQWAGLPLERAESFGTDHAIYRLGRELAGRLPLAVPVPLAPGAPARDSPCTGRSFRGSRGAT